MSPEAISYRDGDTALSGLLYRPAATPTAAVAVFPTIRNTTTPVEAKAQRLAEAGYLALIADFYGEEVRDPAHSRTLAEALRADTGAYRTRCLSAVTAVTAIAPDLPKVAIGFCMGGQAALELARVNAPILLAASFHGLLETGQPADQRIEPRILVCHGDADPMVPRSQVIDFWEEMDGAEANWHFHSYAGVRHGFTAPGAGGGDPNSPVLYDASADRQSWAALLNLMDEVLTQ